MDLKQQAGKYYSFNIFKGFQSKGGQFIKITGTECQKCFPWNLLQLGGLKTKAIALLPKLENDVSTVKNS